MVLKNLLRRKIRTLLTVIGIAVGVSAIIALGAMADGLGAGYTSMLSGSKADLVLSQPDAYDISFSAVDEEVGDELAAMPEVAHVSGMLQGWSRTENEPFFFVFGYPEDSFVLSRFQIISGVGLNQRREYQARGKPVLLGSAAAEVMNKSVGDILRLQDSAFRIIGIYQTGDAFEDSGAILPLKEAQDLLGKSRQVSLFYIQLKDGSMRQRFITRVERKWDDLSLSGVQEYADKQFMQDALEIYVWLIGGLAIVIGGVGMMNAQLMAIFERTREIGVLRALGWSKSRIMRMIMGETLLVSLVGGILGVVLGWTMLYLLSQKTVFLGVINSDISAGRLEQAFVVVMFLGFLGGFYPAWRASRLQPVEALRYEGGSSGVKERRLPVGGMAVQSLWQRSLRTILTLGAIGITVGSIMALEGTIGGMANSMTDLFSNVEIMIRQADISDTSLSVLDERIGEKIAALPGVRDVSGIGFTATLLPENKGFFIIWGYEPRGYAIRRFRVVEGGPLSGSRQIILGRSMADAMAKSVGDTIELSGTRFRVVGIYESSIGFDEMGGVATLRDVQAMMGRPRKVGMYGVKVEDPAQAADLVTEINQRFPDAYATLSGEFADQMPDFQSADYMIAGISFIAILIGGVGVLNTMLMAVFERTREIGVLRALGWRRRAILGLILREALWLGILGGLVGIGIAFGLGYALSHSPMVGEMITMVWNMEVLVRALVIAISLGVFGGLYPAYRATRLQPVEALRYE